MTLPNATFLLKKTMKNRIIISAVTTLFLLSAMNANCQSSKPQLTNKVNVVFGLNQVLSNGFNAEVNIFYKRLAFDYSHGVSLNFDNNMLTGNEKDQKLAVHLPWTTGFGVGYRFTDAFNVRVEPKWHRFEIYYDGDEQNSNTQLCSYNTFTLGVGAYYNWQPFKERSNALKGLMIVPSLRYWPKLSSTLPDDKFVYQNRETNQEELHESMEVGLGNTPWVINVSVGYSFGW